MTKEAAWSRRRIITNPIRHVGPSKGVSARYSPTMPPLAPPTVAGRFALALWLLTATVLALEDHSPFRSVAIAIAPIRRGLGISQSWSMFAPNPGRATYWLELEGRTTARWHRLPQPGTTLPDTTWALRYSRVGKFTRGLVAQGARGDRRRVARWWCDHHPDLVDIRFVHARLQSSPPGVALATGPIRRTPIEVVPCR